MSQQFNNIRSPRTTILTIIEDLSLDQLNTIPAGFNNNILWNLGHMVAAQCGVCYKRAGIAMPIDDHFFETYKPGSRPERVFTAGNLAQVKELMFSTLDKLEADLQTGLFSNYPAWTARYGNQISNINEAIDFLPFHEGLHIGAIMALKKLV